MSDSEISVLLAELVKQGEVHTLLLQSIDARLVEVNQGIASVAGSI